MSARLVVLALLVPAQYIASRFESRFRIHYSSFALFYPHP